jgi:hypothetical protein
MYGGGPRPQSMDTTAGGQERRFATNQQESPMMGSKMPPSSLHNVSSGPPMRPKLKVQIPMGDSGGDSQISSSEPSKDAKDEENRQPGSKPSSATSSSGAGGTGGNGPQSGGPWGSSLLLPPPSPSSYLSTNSGTSSAVGPGNPFGRPPLVTSNGEQTPLSAALPSKYVNDLLPSPSNFYGTEWNTHFGPPSAAAVPNPQQIGLPQSVGMGIYLGGLMGSRSHLAADMLPSPLQFNTPVVASSSQSLGEVRGSPIEKKREGVAELTSVSKRVKVEHKP